MFFEQQQHNNNEMNTPTTTPRTDAATYPADCLGKTLVTNRDCARELERELSLATAACRGILFAAKQAQRHRGAYSLSDLAAAEWLARAAIDAGMKEGA